VLGIAADTSAAVSPAVIVIIPPNTHAIIPSPGPPFVAVYIACGLKNTPEPITTPTTVESAADKPNVFLSSLFIKFLLMSLILFNLNWFYDIIIPTFCLNIKIYLFIYFIIYFKLKIHLYHIANGFVH